MTYFVDIISSFIPRERSFRKHSVITFIIFNIELEPEACRMTKGLMSGIVDKRLSVIITKCIIKRKEKKRC